MQIRDVLANLCMAAACFTANSAVVVLVAAVVYTSLGLRPGAKCPPGLSKLIARVVKTDARTRRTDARPV